MELRPGSQPATPLTWLLDAAVRAPSGDNTQPWQFEIDAQSHRIALFPVRERDPSPMNAGNRMARIAVGAALENIFRVAERNEWQVEEQAPAVSALATVRLVRSKSNSGEMDPLVTARVTNRRLYEGRPVAPNVLTRLIAATSGHLEGVTTHWISSDDHARHEKLADLIGRADALMFGERSMRQAFLGKIRFDAPAAAEVSEGLSLASLELSWSERIGLRLLRGMPDWLLKLGALRAFRKKATKLAQSASGFCLIVARDSSDRADLVVGRAMQRAWLALTAEQLACQPMMSLGVLANALDNGQPQLVAALGRDRLQAVLDEWRKLMPEMGQDRGAFLLRFGNAPPPSGRTGRLPPAISAWTAVPDSTIQR